MWNLLWLMVAPTMIKFTIINGCCWSMISWFRTTTILWMFRRVFSHEHNIAVHFVYRVYNGKYRNKQSHIAPPNSLLQHKLRLLPLTSSSWNRCNQKFARSLWIPSPDWLVMLLVEYKSRWSFGGEFDTQALQLPCQPWCPTVKNTCKMKLEMVTEGTQPAQHIQSICIGGAKLVHHPVKGWYFVGHREVFTDTMPKLWVFVG